MREVKKSGWVLKEVEMGVNASINNVKMKMIWKNDIIQKIKILQRKRSEMTDRIVKLRQYVQFDFYTVDEMFVLQLFDKNNAANDGSDCIWEDDHFDFEALFEQAIAWCEENL